MGSHNICTGFWNVRIETVSWVDQIFLDFNSIHVKLLCNCLAPLQQFNIHHSSFKTYWFAKMPNHWKSCYLELWEKMAFSISSQCRRGKTLDTRTGQSRPCLGWQSEGNGVSKSVFFRLILYFQSRPYLGWQSEI